MLLRLKAPAEAASGKQGNELVYFNWRGGQAARSYAIPTNPQTSYQSTVRAYFDTIVKRWKTLTATQRDGWKTYAASNQVTNRMGVLVTSTALGMYLRMNSINLMRTNGATFVDTAPTGATPSSPASAAIDAVTDGTQLSITNVTHGYTTLTGLYLLAYVQVLPSIAVNPKFNRQVMVQGPDSTSFKPLAITNSAYTWTAPRISVPWGTKVGYSIAIVNESGQMSNVFTKAIEMIAP